MEKKTEVLTGGCQCPACEVTPHASDCAVHNEPAYPNGSCDCGAQQQEPVAYSYTSRITGAQGFSHHPMPRFIDSESWDIKPLYTSPQPSKPLTDDRVWLEYMQLWPFRPNDEPTLAKDILRFARAIESAHGIKGVA